MDFNKHLINKGQSEINDNIKKFCLSIASISKIEDLKEVDEIFYNYFKQDKSTPKFSRSVVEIFESRTFSGCSDIGMMMASILREKGIPTIYVETANIDWLNKAINNLPGNELMMGHIFLEVFINGKWYLYDPTFHLVYDEYDRTNFNYPRRFYVFAKGENANDLGVYNTKDERKVALEILKDYNYTQYTDPMYFEINLKNLEYEKIIKINGR